MCSSDASRWSVLLTVCEPVGVRWLGRAQALVAAGCVAVSLNRQGLAAGWCGVAFLAMFLALVGLALRSGASQSGVLQLASDASGRWALRGQHDHAWHAVAPTRIWRGPGWVTLRLAASGTPASSVPDHAASDAPARSTPKRVWTLTFWRYALPADDWRKLSVLLRAARQFAVTAPAATPA